jgi:AbrB family looped-hinge helix DNA binding protein
MTLKLKVGRKGVVVLPKALRESYGIEEGDSLIVEGGECIALRPEKRRDVSRFEAGVREHTRRIRGLGVKGPKPGELSKIYLEMEFEE